MLARALYPPPYGGAVTVPNASDAVIIATASALTPPAAAGKSERSSVVENLLPKHPRQSAVPHVAMP